MPDRKEVLVTGGCGYIGSHAVRALNDAGFAPVVLDNLTTGHLEGLTAAGDFKLYQADLRDENALEASFKQHRFVGVLHFAGVALVGESVRDPEKYYGANLIGSLNLIAVCKRHGVKNLVFSSTAATYGMPKSVPMSEEHPQHPINPYGRTKLAFEQALQSYHDAGQIRYLALRYFNAAGADPRGDIGEAHDPETHLIPNAFRVVLGQLAHLTVHGSDYPTPDGTCIRDYIHVMDLAEAHVLALTHLLDGKESGALNLGTGQGHSVLEAIKACEAASGRKIPVVMGPRREGDPSSLIADPAKAKQVLGFVPKRSDLKTIAADAWRWFEKHPHGYASE
ncbi:MAG: UDP-glucose 4-epimerase GalE [Planctomycetes bacterium]|nr:UDP-glucose 4-epimerase GalE [Planctomycetota bacterium]